MATKVGEAFVEVRPEFNEFSGLLHNGLTTALKAVGGPANALGLGLGAGIAVAVGAGFVSAAKFEQIVSGIAAVTGATGNDLDQLRGKALQLGKDTVFSAGQAASAMEALAKAGLSTTDILGGAADATVYLAAAGSVDLVEAAAQAADAMNSFALSGKDMPHVADLIAGAANASSIDVTDFGFSLKAVGAVAHIAGLSFDDTATAIAELGKQGIKGSDAGTSLKTMLLNLQPHTKKQTALFEKLGITTNGAANKFFDAQGKIKGLADISQVMQDALRGQTEQQKLLTLQTLFGTDAIRAAAILAQQGAAGFNDIAAAMGKVGAEDVANQRLDNVAGSFEQIKGTVETLLIVLGEPLQKIGQSALNGLLGGLNNVLSSLEAVIPKVESFIGTLRKAISIALADPGAKGQGIWNAVYVGVHLAEDALHGLSTAFGPLLGTVGKFIDSLGGLHAIILPVMAAFAAFAGAGVIGGLIAGLTALVGLLAGPVIAVLTSPIAIIAALAFAVFELYQHFKPLRDAVHDVIGAFSVAVDIFRAVHDGFKVQVDDLTGLDAIFGRVAVTVAGFVNAVAPVFEAVGGFIADHLQPILIILGVSLLNLAVPFLSVAAAAVFLYAKFEVVREGVALFLSVLATIGSFLLDNVLPPVMAFIQQLLGSFSSFGAFITENFAPLMQSFANIFKIAFAVVAGIVVVGFTLIKGFFSLFGDDIGRILGAVFQQMALVVRTTLDIIRGIINIFIGIFTLDFSKFKDGVVGIFGALARLVIQTIGNLGDALGGIFGAIFDLLKNTVGTGFTVIGRFFTALPGQIIGALVNLRDALWGAFFNAMHAVLDALATAGEGIMGFFSSLPGRIVDLLKLLAGELYNSAIESIGYFVAGLITAAVSVYLFFTEIVPKIVDFLKDLPGMLLDKGREILNGLWQGIQEVWDREVHFWTDLPGVVAGYFNSAMDWIYEKGKNIITGLWNGIKEVWNREVNFWTSLPGVVAGYFSNAAKWIYDKGKDGISGLWDGIKEVWNREFKFWTELPGKVISGIGDLAKTLFSSGVNMIQGFIDGLKSMAGKIITAIKESITDKLPGFVKSALGIASPSKVFRALGQQVGAGFAVGIRDGATEIEREMARMLAIPSLTVPDVLGGSSGFSAGGAGAGVNIGSVTVTVQGDATAGTVEQIRSVVHNELTGALVKVVTRADAGAGTR